MNKFGWQVGNEVSTKNGRCIVVAVGDESATLDDRCGNVFEFKFPVDPPVVRVRRERSFHAPDLDLGNVNDSFTLGFLSGCCFLCVRIKESSRHAFEQAFAGLTGAEPWQPGVAGHYYDVTPDDVEGSNDYFHIGFPTPPDAVKLRLSFGKLPGVHWDAFGVVAKYNSVDYVMALLGLGFGLGKSHDCDKIRGKVAYPDAFDEGRRLASEKRADAA
jgi:hypothetical protein